jgi:type IV pilus assembly protein PilY1
VSNRNTLIAAVATAFGLAAPLTVHAQTSVSEDFTRTTTQNAWYYFNGACLTAAPAGTTAVEPNDPSGKTAQIPACVNIAGSYYNKSAGEYLTGGYNGTFPDPAVAAPAPGKGALRFTNGYPYGYRENGGVVFASPFATGQGISITFKTVTYLGDSGGGGGDGADGISFYLMDANKLTTSTITGVSGDGNGLGAWGGSLGYSCSNTNGPPQGTYNGLIGGYLGLGIDEYGNFLNQGDNTATGYGYVPGRIGLRGAGSIAWSELNQNYPTYYPSAWAGTASQYAAVQATCSHGVVWDYAGGKAVKVNNSTIPLPDYAPIPNAYVVLPKGTQIANEKATTRGAATPIFYRLKISQKGLLSFSYATCPPTSPSGCSAFTSVISGQDITTANGPLPANFLFGFAGSTGGSSNVHEILCFKADPSTSAASSAGASEKITAKLETGVQAYFAYYNPSNGWTGRVTASSLYFDPYGNVLIEPTPNWDASCNLTGGNCATTGATGLTAQVPSSRSVLTWDGTSGTPFRYSNLSTTLQGLIDLGDVGPPVPVCNATTAYSTSDRVNYLRGSRSCEVSTAGVGEYRRRSNVLGDVMDSSPSWVGPPDAPYPTAWSDRINAKDPLYENASGAASYTSYATNNQTRQQVVYVGANDGLLHAFRSGTFNSSQGTCSTNPQASCFNLNDGVELLAYMPGTVLSSIHQYDNSSPTAAATAAALDYSNPQYGHHFSVDATPYSGDVFYGGAWHSWLVGGLGPGGSAIYALDITDPSQFAESNASALVLGEWTGATTQTTTSPTGVTTTTIIPGTISCANVTKNCDQNLGNTYGTPQIRRLHDGNWAVIFGNGFGSVSGDAGIYVGLLDPTAGKPLTFYYLSTGCLAASTCGAAKPNGIAFTTPADLDGDHITDYVYAGDLQGNIWKFDLTSGTESSWAVSGPALFKSSSGQPITTQLVVASGAPSPGMQQQLMILFGSGQKTPITNTSGALFATGSQSLYGVWDWNMSGWNAQSTATFSAYNGAPGTLSAANLQQQTVTVDPNTENRDITNSATPCWAGQTTNCPSGNTTNAFGWYLTLPGTQEQVVYNPELVAQALTVNSIVPAANAPTSCDSLSDTGFTYVLSAINGGAFNQVFLPPSATAAGLGKNPAYADMHAIGMKTNATGSSFITSNAAGTQFLIFETNRVETGSGANNIQGATLGLNLPPNTIGHRISWVELR